jgi:uncharacterized membrane protein
MAAFIYVFLVFLVTHKDEHSEFIPQVSLIVSWFIVLSAFAFLVFYSHRVAALIQNPDAIGRIVDDLRSAVADAAPYTRSEPGQQHADSAAALLAAQGHCAMISLASGYLQEIDHTAIVRAAAAAGALVSVRFRPGQFVLEGETLADVSPRAALEPMGKVLTGAVTLGRHRVLSQDLEFGLAQIVEIAIRALSPAINDTFTGIACVDLLGEALTLLVVAPQRTGHWFDDAGTLRLEVRPLLMPRLIKQAFDQIRQAAADNPAVLIRLLSTLGRLAPGMRAAPDHQALSDQAAAVWETANSRPLVAMDKADIEAAWHKARQALAHDAPADRPSLAIAPHAL